MERSPSSPDLRALFLRADEAAPPRTLMDVFRDTVDAHGDAAAIDDGHVTLSYRELGAQVVSRAAELRADGVRAGDRVGVRISSGTAELYVAILAVLEVGAAYVPVDVDDPDERARLVFTEADVAVVLGDGSEVVRRRAAGPDPGPRPPTPRDDAWVIFTSGSTGTPKGVAVSHRSAAAFVDAESRLFLQDASLGPGTGCWRGCPSRSTPRARRCGWPGRTGRAWCRRPARSCAPAWTWGRGWWPSRSV